MKGKIVFETGEIIEGCNLSGFRGKKIGRIIFDTRVVGYEKILTCPEYQDKLVVFSYPLIGNYGINREDLETGDVFPSAIIISEVSSVYSNFRAYSSLEDFLSGTEVAVAEGADTRQLTCRIRDNKDLWAAIVPCDGDPGNIVAEIKAKKDSAKMRVPAIPASEKTQDSPHAGKPYISVLNLGLKNSEMSFLRSSGFPLKMVVPGSEHAEEVISSAAAVYITSGPDNLATIDKARRLIEKHTGKIPLCGAGLGHIIAGMAMGGEISGVSVNHYGVNHPVFDSLTKGYLVTEQSHSLVLNADTLSAGQVRYVNLNDETVEGLYDAGMKVATVSFCPREEDFENFFSLIKG